MTARSLLLSLALASVLGGCIKSNHSSSVQALFDPAGGVVPVPSDILFLTSADGTLDAPVADPADVTDLGVQLNALDGWSTAASFTVSFEAGVAASSAVPGKSVRMFIVEPDTRLVARGGGVSRILSEVDADDFEVTAAAEDSSGATLRILPTVPLQPATSYMVIITNAVVDAKGRATSASDFFFGAIHTSHIATDIFTIAAQSMVEAAQVFGVKRSTIIFANTFTTQSIGATLAALYEVSMGGEQAVIDGLVAGGLLDTSAGTSTQISASTVAVDGGPFPTVGGLASVYTGGLTVPYYLAPASNSSATAPVIDFAPNLSWWRARFPFALASGTDSDRNLSAMNTLPQVMGVEEIPMLVSIPVSSPPASGKWPVVIFQHGITADRSNLFGIADALAAAGFAAVAIDLPLHGLDSSSPFFTGYLDGGRRERTFGMDVWDNATGAIGPDGTADGSGSSFINLGLPLVSRDNIRQAVSDLFHLTDSLADIDVDGDLVADLDPDQVYFVGHSLGGIIGTIYLRYAEQVRAASLGMPGGAIPKLLEGSAAFGPVVTAGLMGAGLTPGTADWESFFTVAQALIDTADPINHAGAGLNTVRPTHLIEVVGSTTSLPDLVVPNSVAGAPLAGTDPLIAALGLDLITATTTSAGGVRVAVRFSAGGHSSLLEPFTDALAFTEMQSQVAIFLASDGTAVIITDDSVIAD
ncbi:MAG: alpha/beta fold hydrolase [Planctomycetes bacterium]|nr:alpha/beta fold hydrolase [Planctomycetota bacterium]